MSEFQELSDLFRDVSPNFNMNSFATPDDDQRETDDTFDAISEALDIQVDGYVTAVNDLGMATTEHIIRCGLIYSVTMDPVVLSALLALAVHRLGLKKMGE